MKLLKASRKLKVLLGITAVLACLGLGYWFLSGSMKKSDAEAQVKSALSSIDLEGDLIYSKVRDNGCFTNDMGWFGIGTTCAYVGEKFYKGRDNLHRDIEKLDQKLTSLGWYRQGSIPSHDELQSSSDENRSAWINYSNDSANLPSLSLTFISNKALPSGTQYTPRSELLQIQQTTSLSAEEYLYGVSLFQNY